MAAFLIVNLKGFVHHEGHEVRKIINFFLRALRVLQRKYM